MCTLSLIAGPPLLGAHEGRASAAIVRAPRKRVNERWPTRRVGSRDNPYVDGRVACAYCGGSRRAPTWLGTAPRPRGAPEDETSLAPERGLPPRGPAGFAVVSLTAPTRGEDDATATDGRPSLRRALGVFVNRHYRFLWLSSTCSFLGMNVQQVARALLAWDLSESFGAMGAISLSFGLPMLLLSLPGGAVADRVDKRNLSLFTQAATGVLALMTAVMIATGLMTLPILFGLGLVQGTLFALGMPARSPLMALVVGPHHLLSAIALSNASMNATRLIGPAIAGVLAGTLGLAAAYYLQALMYAASVACLLLVPSGLETGIERSAPRGSVVHEIGRGVRYVAADARLRVLMLMGFILAFFGMPYVMLLAGFVQRDLGQGKEAVGWLMSVSGIGALVGSLLVATITDFPRKALVQFVAGLLGGVALIALALLSSTFGYAGAIGGIVLLGFALNGYQTLNSAMVMEASRPEYYGRVMSIVMLTFSSMSVMAAPLGLLADRVGAGTLFVVQGGLIIVAMLLVSLLNPAYIFGSTAGTLFPGTEAPATPALAGTGASATNAPVDRAPEP